MARVGGRNAAFAWIVGVFSVAVIVVLAVLALPLLPGGVALFGGTTSTTGSAGPSRAPIPGEPRECQDLYSEALWASLRWAGGSAFTDSYEMPDSAETDVVEQLVTEVRFTCDWVSDRGEITTTYADAPADAASLIRTVLSERDFSCTKVGDDHTRCTRTTTADDEDETRTVETIEAGDGRWLSTTQVGWFPENYPSRIAGPVWAVRLAE